MTDAGRSMTLEYAKAYAGRFVALIAPYAERVLVVGSIRRARPEVHDVDVLAIPRLAKKEDWFGGKFEQNLLVDEVDRLIATHRVSARKKKDGTTMVGNGVAFLDFDGWPVDLYYATEKTWVGLMLVRTGSAGHNQQMAGYALHQGKRFRADGTGIWNAELTKRLDDGETEESIFKALGIPYRRPEEREVVPKGVD